MRSLARLFGRSVHPQVARPLVLTRMHHLACPACRSGCFSADSTNCVSLVSYSAVLGRRRMGPHRGRVLLGFLGRRPPSIVLACYSAFLTQRVGASCSVATWHTRRLAFLGDRSFRPSCDTEALTQKPMKRSKPNPNDPVDIDTTEPASESSVAKMLHNSYKERLAAMRGTDPDDFDIVFRLFASYETRFGVSNQFMQTNILAALAHLLNPGAPTCRAIDQTLRSSLATCSLRILPPCPQPSARTRHAKA